MVIVGRDSVVAITFSQMDSVNNTFIWNDQLRSQDSLLCNKLDSCITVFKLFHHSDSIQSIQIQLRDTVIAKQGILIHDQNKLITKLRIHKGIMGVAITSLLVVIGYMAIHSL